MLYWPGPLASRDSYEASLFDDELTSGICLYLGNFTSRPQGKAHTIELTL